MSKKANPTVIGLFIVIGLALGVAALITFTSGKFFSKRQKFILYFDASLKGLSVGAPVKMRGVTIGSVVEVLIRHNQASNDFAMPVIIEIEQELVKARSDRYFDIHNKTQLEQMLRQGLRAKLDSQSLVTGVLYIELAFEKDAEPLHFHQLMPEYPEIPTTPTDIQELMANLARFDLKGISDKLNAVLARLDNSLSELNLRQINAGTTNLLASVERLLASPDLTNSLFQLSHALTDARSLVRRLDTRVEPLVNGVTNTLHRADGALAELRQALQGFGGMVEPNATLRTDLAMSLDQVANAARALADFIEFLQRNPNALLTGRKPPESKP